MTPARSSPPPDVISRAELRAALLRSGYLFERRVADWLEHAGWATLANKPYPDPRTGETRELDIEAFEVRSAGPHRLDLLLPTLLIECVNNPQPVAFIVSNAKWPDLHVKAFRYAGEPMGVFKNADSDEIISLEAFCDLPSIHCRGVFSTQYCSFEQKGRGSGKGEWFATHSNEHHKVFTDLVDALDHHVAVRDRDLPRKAAPGASLTLFYPVLVLQGDIYAAQVSKRSVSVKIADHVQYRRSVMRGGERTTYHIDVVTERRLPGLLKQIETEVQHIADALKKHPDLVQRSSEWLRRVAEHPV